MDSRSRTNCNQRLLQQTTRWTSDARRCKVANGRTRWTVDFVDVRIQFNCLPVLSYVVLVLLIWDRLMKKDWQLWASMHQLGWERADQISVRESTKCKPPCKMQFLHQFQWLCSIHVDISYAEWLISHCEWWPLEMIRFEIMLTASMPYSNIFISSSVSITPEASAP